MTHITLFTIFVGIKMKNWYIIRYAN
jgi:hypothetical protein